MKQKFIAAAWFALPGAAMAEVTIYGQIKGGVEASQVRTGSAWHSDGQSHKTSVAAEVADFDSRFGFKGSERLGND